MSQSFTNTIFGSRNKFLKLFILILLIKLVFLFIANGFNLFANYELSKLKGDAKTYLIGATNLVTTGSYEFTDNGDGVTKYVLRMPGMALILAPLLWLFSLSNAIKLFILIQIVISSFAYTVLFVFLKKRISNLYLLSAIFCFIAFSSFVNDYTASILSETIAQSLFIIILCYLIELPEFKMGKELLLMGLIFAWLFFLRPFMIVFFPFLVLRILFSQGITFNIKKIFAQSKPAVAFSIFLVLFTGIWTIRNYNKTTKLIPMEYSVKADKVTYLQEFTPALFAYIKRFDGNIYTTYNDQKTSHYLWFYPEKILTRKNIKRPSDEIFPESAFNSSFNFDSLNSIRIIIDSAMNYKFNSPERIKYFEQFSKRIEIADAVAKSNNGFLFTLNARVKNLWCFINPTISDNKYYFNSSKLKKITSVVNKGFNLVFVTVFVGLFSVLFLINKKWLKEYWYYLIPSFSILFIFSFYFNIREERELFTFYPIFLITGSLFAEQLINKIEVNFFKK